MNGWRLPRKVECWQIGSARLQDLAKVFLRVATISCVVRLKSYGWHVRRAHSPDGRQLVVPKGPKCQGESLEGQERRWPSSVLAIGARISPETSMSLVL